MMIDDLPVPFSVFTVHEGVTSLFGLSGAIRHCKCKVVVAVINGRIPKDTDIRFVSADFQVWKPGKVFEIILNLLGRDSKLL